jgi:hypothetical protein
MTIDWNKLSNAAKSVIQVAAPTVGMAFGGPLGSLAGNMLAQTLGCIGTNGRADTKQVDALLTAGNPETFLKLKQAENDFTARMAELGIQEDQLTVQDRSNARDLGTKDMWTPRTLGALIYLAFFISAYIVICKTSDFPQNISLLVGNIMGVFGTLAVQVANYYFGTSFGSQNKDAMLFNSTPVK